MEAQQKLGLIVSKSILAIQDPTIIGTKFPDYAYAIYVCMKQVVEFYSPTYHSMANECLQKIRGTDFSGKILDIYGN